MRYRWEIKTSDAWYAGTDANVFLSLNGLDAGMREVQNQRPGRHQRLGKGDINHGSIETEDLGELQTGTLQHDQSGPASGWSVGWVKVTNGKTVAEWTATVGKFDEGGRFPLLRFTRTNDGQYDVLQSRRRSAQRTRQRKTQRTKPPPRRRPRAGNRRRRFRAGCRDGQAAEGAGARAEEGRDGGQARRAAGQSSTNCAAVARRRVRLRWAAAARSAPMSCLECSMGATSRSVGWWFSTAEQDDTPWCRVGALSSARHPARVWTGGVPGRWSAYYGGRSRRSLGSTQTKASWPRTARAAGRSTRPFSRRFSALDGERPSTRSRFV